MVELEPGMLEESTKALKFLTELYPQLTDSSKTLEENLANLKEEIIRVGSSASETDKKISHAFETVSKSGAAILVATTNIGNLANGFDEFAKASGAVAGNSSAVDLFTKTGGAVRSLLSSVPGASQALALLGSAVGTMGERFAKAMDATKGLETGYISLMAQSGNLGTVFRNGGTELNDFDEQMSKFVDRTYELQKATGHLTPEIAKIQKELGVVPGMLTSNFDVFGKAMSATEGFIKVMDGASRSSSDLAKDVKFAYDALGYGADKADKAFGVISQMSIASETLGIRFDDVHEMITKAGTAFQFLGDNTEAAVRVLGRMAPALQEVGASPKQAITMIEQMTEGIHKMDTASKAFINQRGGGVGGLQGAFQIDKLIKEGKYDEVMEKAQAALKKQVGNRIVTLDEAGSSPQAAAQYQRQLSFAQSGAFGSQIKAGPEGAQQAAKFFDAMAKGSFDKAAKQIMGQEDARDTVLKRGKNIQERNTTGLVQFDADTRKFLQHLVMEAAGKGRKMFGSESKAANYIAKNAEIAGDNAIMTKANEGNIDHKTKVAQDGLDLAGKISGFYNAFTKKEEKDVRPEQPNAALMRGPLGKATMPGADSKTQPQQTPRVAAGGIPTMPGADSKGKPGEDYMSLFHTNTQKENARRQVERQIGAAAPAQARAQHARAQQQEVAKVSAKTTATAAAAPAGPTNNQPQRIEGTLDVKCPNCGTNNKAELHAELARRDNKAMYGK